MPLLRLAMPRTPNALTSRLSPRVADTILLLPRPRLPELLSQITNRSSAGLHHDHLHFMCDWLGNIRYFVPPTQWRQDERVVYDSNSFKVWNPLYR